MRGLALHLSLSAACLFALVSCTKTKAPRACAAAELYQPSFFRLAYGYVRQVSVGRRSPYFALRIATVHPPSESGATLFARAQRSAIPRCQARERGTHEESGRGARRSRSRLSDRLVHLSELAGLAGLGRS